MPRQFAIADIHGCCRTFRELIFKRITLTRDDVLYLLGDYIDRGPDSKGVLDTIIELQNTGYKIHPILGNHEYMLLTALYLWGMSDWLEYGGRETLQSYAIEHAEEMPTGHIEFLQKLPDHHVADTHVLVHAGLNFSLDDPLKDTSQEFKLWDRHCREAFPNKIGDRKLVVGHTIRHLDEIKRSLKKDCVSLDNGCFIGNDSEGKGNLVAFELESGKLFIQKNIE
ncbi:MAG: metallophosphoesterase [Desulfuromonadales bacterium]